MNREELEEEISERAMQRSRGPYFSVPSTVAIVISLSSTMVAFGVLVSKVDANADRVGVLEQQSRTITPGAAVEIAGIKATDYALAQQVADLRVELRTGRQDVQNAIKDFSEKLDRHVEMQR